MFRIIRKLAASWRVWCAIIFITWFSVTVVVWWQNAEIYWQTFTSATLSAGERLSFFLAIYKTLGTSFSAFDASMLSLLSFLLGVYVVLFAVYVQRSRGRLRAGSAAGLFGFVAGLFGIGCAACGAVIFSSVLGLFGGAAFLAALPLHGVEFALLGIALLVLSNYYILKKIADPLVCVQK